MWTYQFRPQPGYCSIYLRPPQLFVGLVTPADADWSDSGARLLRIFSGLSCGPEGMNQFVFNVLQNHGGQSVLAVAVSVHAGRVWMCAPLTCCLPALSLTDFVHSLVKLWESSLLQICTLQILSELVFLLPPVSAEQVCVLLLCSCTHPFCLPGVELACFVIVTMEKLPSACMPSSSSSSFR